MSASSAPCRFPSAARGVCWQSLGVEPGAGQFWLGTALPASGKGPELTEEVPRGIHQSCVTLSPSPPCQVSP